MDYSSRIRKCQNWNWWTIAKSGMRAEEKERFEPAMDNWHDGGCCQQEMAGWQEGGSARRTRT